jgi:hypothetical protein
MACGNPFEVLYSSDPKNMPGQGLAQADNYSPDVANWQYGGIVRGFTDPNNQNAILQNEKTYRPQYIEQDLANTGQAMGGNLALLNQYGGQINDTRRSLDPAAWNLNDLMLNQATEDVQAGSNLNAAQQRAAQQSSRAGMAARGMGGTNQALADEMLAQFDLGEKLKNERRGFAMNTLAMNKNLQQGQTPQDWLNMATTVGRTATPGLTPVSAQAAWMNSVYGENQANNRTTAGLETQVGMHQADIWNDWMKTGVGAMAGGGAGAVK